MRVLTIVLALCLAGCGSTRDAQGQLAERETTITERPAFAPDGTGYVEKTVTTRVRDQVTSDQATTTIHVPAIGSAVSAVVSAAGGLSTGGLSTALVGVGGTALTALSLYLQKRRQVNDLKADVEYHKADAAEGWAKAIPKDDAT